MFALAWQKEVAYMYLCSLGCVQWCTLSRGGGGFGDFYAGCELHKKS